AVHTATFNSKVDSVRASVVGASGAATHHQVSSNVEARIGDGTRMTTGDLSVVARNASRKAALDSGGIDWRIGGSDNAKAGSGGVVGGAAVSSASTITHTTRVSVGNDAVITVRDGSQGRTNFSAVNDILVRDRTNLHSGDAISLALAKSTVR